ncbi:hypothetical protein [Dysgonomonas sp. ZJ709]|uniref:hypothetical protein n=1 Tax=Dysgonomonas sp. ZJ709 TaxID=2709797 RepID=UPI0013E9A77F|nr:hypothetical protein [Dysgonomonas sp. ZJ709]
MKTFLSQARNQIEKVIPANSDLYYYVGAEIENIAFASYIFSIEDEKSFQTVCILAFPANFDLNAFFREEIRKFRDILVENDSLLIIIYEDQAKGTRNSLGDFLSEELYLLNRNYIVLPSYNEANFKTTINGINYLTISKTLEYILNGQIQFIAPNIGLNQVNIEILSDACPSCKSIFPNVLLILSKCN